MASNESHSYVSMERLSKHARQRVCPELEDDDPLPLGAAGVFERLDQTHVGDESSGITPLIYAVSSLRAGVEGEARYLLDAKVIQITLSPETYGALEARDPRALFTTCHEIVHAFAHRPLLRLLPVLPHEEVALLRERASHPIYNDTEWQADVGAAAMIMPAMGLERLRLAGQLTPSVVTKVFGASAQAASDRIRIFNDRREDLLDA